MKKLFGMLALSIAVMAPAVASVIVDHSNGGLVNGLTYTNIGGTNWTVWDDFTLTSGASINEITYYSFRTSASSSPYTLMIGTAAGKSDVYSATIAAASVTEKTVNDVGVFDATFAPLNLSAGTYWLTFNNAANLGGSANVAGANLVQILSGTQYVRGNSASDFILGGTVPEPGSLSLLALGAAGFVVARRKRA